MVFFDILHLMIVSNQHLDKRVEGGVAELGCANGPHILPHVIQTVPVENLQHDEAIVSFHSLILWSKYYDSTIIMTAP